MDHKDPSFLRELERRLRDAGFAVSLPDPATLTESGCKVICVPAGLQGSLQALGRETRDHVVMVRVDESTHRALDAWVETGALRSRSEAAALFIREGLRLRAEELAELASALGDLRRAKDRVRRQARTLLGEDATDADA